MRQDPEQRLREVLTRAQESFETLVKKVDEELRASGVDLGEFGGNLNIIARVNIGDASYGFTRNDLRRVRLLTQRETEVAQLAANGLANKNIAIQLKIQQSTVAAHLRRIYEKLDVGSRAELTQKIALWS